jgi:hypothetical protein
MNSIIQSFFHFPILRSTIQAMDSRDQFPSSLNVQRLFALTQLGSRPWSALGLMRSFGWTEEQ